jgi:C1A family cysteine protease
MTIRKYGWKKSQPDSRDYKLKTVNPAIYATLPSAVDLRPLVPEVLDQGQFSSCTANALSMAMRITRKKQGLSDQALSRMFIYFNERLMEGTVDQDSGAQLRDGAKVLATIGAPAESEWQYLDSNLYLEPTKQAYQSAVQDESRVSLTVDQTLDEMKLCLHEGFPFVFGATLFPEFESDMVARSGMVPMPRETDQPIGGHAILCVGYSNSSQRFKVLNSWGPNWGDCGYCYFPYEYLTNSDLCSDLWTIRSIAPIDPNRTWVVPPVQQDS